MKKDKINSSCGIKTSIGGQALMEGIMMRGPKRSAMAVRNPQGEIVVEEWDTKVSARSKFFKLPIIRGVFNFADSIVCVGGGMLAIWLVISLIDEAKAEKLKKKQSDEQTANNDLDVDK